MTAPPWELPEIRGTPLTADRSSEVCIVGAGLVGLTVAYLLARDGHEVTVLDAGSGGTGETWRTTAHLVTALDRGWTALRALHGDEHARVAAASHTAAIARIERLVVEEAIACDFRRVDGYLFGSAQAGSKALLDELAAAQAAGIDGVEIVARTPLPGMDVGPSLRFPAQGRLHPSRYLRGLAEAALRAGAVIAPRTPVVDIEDHGPLAVRTSSGATVSAGAVVVATNTPINTTVAIHVKQAAYRSYVIAAPVRRGAVPDALYWDTEEPFHYVRLADGPGDHELLLVGGEDHKTGQDGDGPDARFARLEQWTRERFPVAGPLAARWSGQVMESMDGLAFIGPLHAGGRLYVVSGDSGNGFTHATVAGLLLADLVAGRENPWAATYDPSRVRMRALGTLASENLNVARQLADWVDGAETHDPATVAPGTGRIVRRGVRLAAVYREPDGSVHELSAVCPHLGCIVRWNTGERSWDCPCHGSRFDPTGHVVHGPAHRDLEPAAPEARRRAS